MRFGDSWTNLQTAQPRDFTMHKRMRMYKREGEKRRVPGMCQHCFCKVDFTERKNGGMFAII